MLPSIVQRDSFHPVIGVLIGALLLQRLPRLSLAQGERFSMTSRGQNLVLNAGQQVSLECRFTMRPFSLFKNPVIWNKTQHDEVTRVNMMGNILDPYLDTGRFRVDLHTEEPDYAVTLVISELSLEDSGNYTCEVRAPGNRIVGSIAHYLFVRAPVQAVHVLGGKSTPPRITSSPTITCDEDKATAMSCVATGGYPPPDLEVYLGDQNITDLFSIRHSPNLRGVTGLKLMVYTTERYTNRFVASARDNGRLVTCVATVSGLPSNISSSKLEVHYAPIILCEPSSAYIGQRNIYIACEVDAKPQITLIYWTLDQNGTTILEGNVINEYWTLVSDLGGSKVGTRLYHREATHDVFHSYTVCAKNDIGITTHQVLLEQRAAPADSSNQPIISSVNGRSDSRQTTLADRKRSKPLYSSGSWTLCPSYQTMVVSIIVDCHIFYYLIQRLPYVT